MRRDMRQLLRGKIHRATVTAAEPDYVGSIVIDQDLLERADIWPGEKVLVSDVDNAARFETYAVIGWEAAVDDVGVVGYEVLRDGVLEL